MIPIGGVDFCLDLRVDDAEGRDLNEEKVVPEQNLGKRWRIFWIISQQW